MSKETKNKIIPTLRFPEFKNCDAWTEEALGSVCETFSGGTPLTTEKAYYGGSIPFIRSGEIDRATTELFLTEEGLKNSSAKLINKGDVLVALYGANSGDVALAKIDGAINQAILCLKSEKSNSFIYQFLFFKKNWIISTYLQGGQGNLSGEIIKSINLYFPDSKEQKKIAACLSSLDDLITAHNQKLDALKAHKKGLMQQLFPAEGDTSTGSAVPKLRFKGFKEKWVEKRIDEFAPLQRGFDLPIEKIIPGNYPVVFSNGILKFHSQYKVKAPGIVTGRSGTIGKVTYVDKDFWPHNTALWVTDFCGNFPLFVYYYLVLIGLERFAAGGGVPTLNRNDVHLHKIYVPISLEEQKKIASCLSSLDELITAQAEKIEELKKHKKGLMQGLFPEVKD